MRLHISKLGIKYLISFKVTCTYHTFLICACVNNWCRPSGFFPSSTVLSWNSITLLSPRRVGVGFNPTTGTPVTSPNQNIHCGSRQGTCWLVFVFFTLQCCVAIFFRHCTSFISSFPSTQHGNAGPPFEEHPSSGPTELANPNLYHAIWFFKFFSRGSTACRFCDCVCDLWLQKTTQNGWHLPHTVCYLFLSLILNVSVWQYLSRQLLILHAYPASQQNYKVKLYIILSRNYKTSWNIIIFRSIHSLC